MGACETTPPASTGNTHAIPDKPTATEPFLASDDLPPLAGVQLVRPRRCAATGAPAGPPGRAAGRPGQLRGRSRRIVSPARTAARSRRARFVRPLDNGGPHGCRIAGGGHSDTYASLGILIRGPRTPM